MMNKKNVAGFTLIELLVVIAVIALLLAVLVPALSMAKEHAKRLPLVAEKYAEVDRNKSVVTDIIWNFDNLSHVVGNRPRGLSALFGDGHVNFSISPEAFDPALWGDSVRPGSIEFRTILNLLKP